MLTVDYDRLGLQPGEKLLDLGCGAGRHAYEAMRRGAWVTALDYDASELEGVTFVAESMIEAGEVPDGGGYETVHGDATDLPFEDATFDRVIASEVLEHIPSDALAMTELARVLKPGGTMAVTVPRFGPELVNWALSDRYHSVAGGHIRIYRRSQLQDRLAAAGLEPTGYDHAHGLHSPYWWLKCLVGLDRDRHPLVVAYNRVLVWDIVKAPLLTRAADAILSPVVGKSLVVYVRKPADPAIRNASKAAA